MKIYAILYYDSTKDKPF